MEKKEEKKGFWASLFAPKPSSCCGSVIEEVKEEAPKQNDTDKEEKENESKTPPTCGCGGNC